MQLTTQNVTYEYVECTRCAGSGKRFSVHKGGFNDCDHCKGTGGIITSHVCACGAPVRLVEDKLLYCGRKQCLIDLQTDRKDSEWDKAHPAVSTYARHWPGHGERFAE